jgi:hypothetical protein
MDSARPPKTCEAGRAVASRVPSHATTSIATDPSPCSMCGNLCVKGTECVCSIPVGSVPLVGPKSLLVAAWSPSGIQLPIDTLQYTPDPFPAKCIQSFPDRVDSHITTNWAVEASVKHLHRDDTFFHPCSSHCASLAGLPTIPQALKCHPKITPRQIVAWPTTPVPIILNYPRSKRLYRTTNTTQVSELLTASSKHLTKSLPNGRVNNSIRAYKRLFV